MKIEEWLHKLDEPYKSQALFNFDKVNIDEIYDSIDEALVSAFYWKDTAQGYDYWDNLYNILVENENLY